MRVKDKAALVAGGGQGIGEGIVLCLAEEGADLVVVDIQEEQARRVADTVQAMGRKALAVPADLTREEEARKAVQKTVEYLGRIDILVNNVGGVPSETFLKLREQRELRAGGALPEFLYFNPEVWDDYYRLNLGTHVLMCQAVAPYFIQQRSGKILNVSSVSGRLPEPGHMPYGAMKAADISLTWSLAMALAPYNVNVNCLCPGFVYTPLWERGAEVRRKVIKEAIASGQEVSKELAQDIETLPLKELWLKYLVLPYTPLKREQTAEDMGRAAVFLVSEEARNITGQVLHVDGGLAMR